MEKISNTTERLKELMQSEKLKQMDILEKCEPLCKKYNIPISKSLLSAWIRGKALPRQDRIHVLALALNVSETWLMGYDVPRKRSMSDLERAKFEIDRLTDEQRRRLFAYYDALMDLQKEDN